MSQIETLPQPEYKSQQYLEGIAELSDACFYNFLDEATKLDR